MKLKQNQLNLLRHLAQFEALDYATCLWMLDTEKTNDRVALSYAFRPLTKNKYVSKRKDGSVRILAKGRALFPEVKPLVTLGGGAAGTKRVISISRTAAFLRRAEVESFAHPNMTEYCCFIPSTCWREIRNGILSTARFTGILFYGDHRLAVYDIGDGTMEWQMKAERSLFYWRHSEYETKATGMLLICDDDKRDEVAQRIIRHTMWQRKQLIDKSCSAERNKPVQYSRSSIRVSPHFVHVYLTTPEQLYEDIQIINNEDYVIGAFKEDHPHCVEPKEGDYEAWPYRCFINITTDLLKYVYFFARVKEHIKFMQRNKTELRYAIAHSEKDNAIVRMYPDVLEMEGVKIHEYRYGDDIESFNG